MDSNRIKAVEAGGNAVLTALVSAIKTERGVQAEMLLCSIGALGGYACQYQVRSQLNHEEPPALQEFMVQSKPDGRHYYFGSLINKQLYNGEQSFGQIAAGALLRLGRKKIPDLSELLHFVASTVGTPYFGKIRIPDSKFYIGSAEKTLAGGWDTVLQHALQYCGIEELPMLFGYAAQQAIIACKDAMPPEAAWQIVMEAAISMSAVELKDADPTE